MNAAVKEAFRVLNRARFYSTLEILRPLPLEWSTRWLRLQGRATYYLQPTQRKRATAWLKAGAAAGRSDAEIAQLARSIFICRAFNAYLSYLLLIHDARRHPDWITVEGWNHVEEALGRNRGVVLLTSHIGVPSAERWFLRTQPHPVKYLYRVGFPGRNDPSWKEGFQRWHRKRYGADDDDLAGNEELSVQYMKKAYDHLRRNGIVNLAGTGRKGSGQRYPVTFGGRARTMASGGISLGLLSGAAIVPLFTLADETPRFRIEFQEPLTCPPGDRTDQTRMLVEAFAARIDGFISRHPAMAWPQWMYGPGQQPPRTT